MYDRSLHRFRRPNVCQPYNIQPDGDRGGNKRLVVPAFWLQETPTTNAQYWPCVQIGACTPPDHDIADPNPKTWDDPARRELPVYVRHDQSEDFCRWAKGRLPSLAELTLAAQGDVEIPGIAVLTQTVIDCFGDRSQGTADICDTVQLMNYSQTQSPPLYRVKGMALDVGPFGHTDLFGSVWEWTRTQGGSAGDGHFCDLADGSPDFVTFGPSPNMQSDVVNFATPMINAVQGDGWDDAVRIMPDASNRYNVGFRCAFDKAD